MIRINLRPFREQVLIQSGQRQLLVLVAGILVSLLVCVILYTQRGDPEAPKRQLEAEKRQWEARRVAVEEEETCDVDKIKGQIRTARRRFAAVDRLFNRRATPKWRLREIKRVLSPTWGPTLSETARAKSGGNKSLIYNLNWDPKGVWLTHYEEGVDGVKIEGGAKAADDIAEFNKRMQLSAFFSNADVSKFSQVQSEGKKKKPYLKFFMTAARN